MDKQLYEAFDAIEATHWWFVARASIVTSVLRRLPAERRRRILDIGCGTGGILPELRPLGEVAAIEMFPEAAELARAKSDADVRIGSLPDKIPFAAGQFDVITLLDVIEHVEDDVASLFTVHELLKPGGHVLITVPAHMYLWSEHDVLNEHKRRYEKDELKQLLARSGFEIELFSYYNMFLFPAVALMRLLRGRKPTGKPQLGMVPKPVNALLTGIFGAERFLLPRMTLPVGVSIIALARRREHSVSSPTELP